MKLDQYILETMFEKSLFSDLSLAFYHSSFPFTMRFDVHKAIVAQAPFFRLLLDNTHKITTVDTDAKTETNIQKGNTLYLTIDLIEAMTRHGFVMAPFQHIVRRRWQKPATPTASDSNTVDQSQHILSSHLRFALKWLYSMERTLLMESLKDEDTLRVLCVAVLFGLQTLVDSCLERYTTCQLSITSIIRDLETICQLPRSHRAYHQLRDAALLLLLRYGPDHPRHLARLPVDYMSDVLSADLLYVGCEYERYCLLREVLVAFMQSVGKITWTTAGPVDQDSKRLSGFVRKPLLPQQESYLEKRKVEDKLQRPPQKLSVSDVRQCSQKRKRIPSEELLSIDEPNQKQQRKSRLSFSACIPFEKLVADASSGGVIDKATILSYLLRTTVNYSNMTFDQLTIVRQDGIVDESIVFRALWQREALDRLLFPFSYQQSQQKMFNRVTPSSPSLSSSQTILQHTRGTADQTAIPRHGKLDNEANNDIDDASTGDQRRAALDEYFDVDSSDNQERRRRILLGTPRFRFCSSVEITLPCADDYNGWNEVVADKKESTFAPTTSYQEEANSEFDELDGVDEDSLWVAEEDVEASLNRGADKTGMAHVSITEEQRSLRLLAIGSDKVATKTAAKRSTKQSSSSSSSMSYENTPSDTNNYTNNDTTHITQRERSQQHSSTDRFYTKTVYSDAEYILGHWHRVKVEVQVLPRSLLKTQRDNEGDSSEDGSHENYSNKKHDESDDDAAVICQFELQRDKSTYSSTDSSQVSQQQLTENNDDNTSTTTPTSLPQKKSQLSTSTENSDSVLPVRQESKIRYAIYCLNRHEGLLQNDQVDPEDRVLVPVSEVTESSDPSVPSTGYVGQIKLDTEILGKQNSINVDMVVALEVFGFHKV